MLSLSQVHLELSIFKSQLRCPLGPLPASPLYLLCSLAVLRNSSHSLPLPQWARGAYEADSQCSGCLAFVLGQVLSHVSSGLLLLPSVSPLTQPPPQTLSDQVTFPKYIAGHVPP